MHCVQAMRPNDTKGHVTIRVRDINRKSYDSPAPCVLALVIGVTTDEQRVALTGRNRTGPPCSVGRSTADAPGRRPARPPAALQTTTTDDRR